MTETLAPGEVRLVLVDPDGVDDDALDASERLLSQEERAYLGRCNHLRRRREFLVGRSLLRRTLSRFTEVAPADWVFTENERGRPERAGPSIPTDLRFNLSHTHGLVAVAVAEGGEVGVDVEWTERGGRTVELADRWFTPEETAALRALPTEARRSRFFDLWTLKESYIKARGLGLAIPLHSVSFDPARDPIALRLEASVADSAERWVFALLSPTDRHRAAVALEVGEEPLRVALEWA